MLLPGICPKNELPRADTNWPESVCQQLGQINLVTGEEKPGLFWPHNTVKMNVSRNTNTHEKLITQMANRAQFKYGASSCELEIINLVFHSFLLPAPPHHHRLTSLSSSYLFPIPKIYPILGKPSTKLRESPPNFPIPANRLVVVLVLCEYTQSWRNGMLVIQTGAVVRI